MTTIARASSAPSARSCQAPVHNQQKGRLPYDPRALFGGYGRRLQSGFSHAVLTTSLLNWRGLRSSASFSRPHSHWLVMSLPSQLVRQSAFAGARHITNSARFNGANRSPSQSLSHQHSVGSLAEALHFHRPALSSARGFREVTCATKGLGNVRKAFGELRNV